MTTIRAEFAQLGTELRSLAWQLHKLTGRSLLSAANMQAIIDTATAFGEKLGQVHALAQEVEKDLTKAGLLESDRESS